MQHNQTEQKQVLYSHRVQKEFIMEFRNKTLSNRTFKIYVKFLSMPFVINCNEKLYECETWSFLKGRTYIEGVRKEFAKENICSQDRGRCLSKFEES